VIDIKFEIDGKVVHTNNIADALERAMFNTVADELRTTLASVRDPHTGEFPTVVVRGNSLENMSIQIEGSEAVVALAEECLGDDLEKVETGTAMDEPTEPPHVFLCHASEDKPIVRTIATDLRANGIEVFFDEWSIKPGESIRQRIDDGLSACTHFVVLLTATSLEKSWVNAEIDAGFVRKLSGQCSFVPLRYQLDSTELPPLLAPLNSPSLQNYEDDIRDLVGFFFGVTRTPPLGPPPDVVTKYDSALGISPAAKRVVDIMMERSEHGLSMDPQIGADDLKTVSNLTDEEIIDAVHELEGRGLVRRHRALSAGALGFIRVVSEAALFVEFDKYYCTWHPNEDGLRVAAELINRTDGDEAIELLAKRLGWSPRRMNPALSYLIERDFVMSSQERGTHPWRVSWIQKTDATRRFVSSRS